MEKIRHDVIDMICPSHGPIIRQDPWKVIQQFENWSKPPTQNKKIVILFLSPHGSTEKMAHAVASGANCHGIEVSSYHINSLTAGELRNLMEEASALIFGMRGNIFRSTDAGRTWKKVATDTKVAFNGGRAFDDGMVVLAGNSGKLALSRDNGQTFEVKGLPGRGYASALKRSDGELLVVGDRGIERILGSLDGFHRHAVRRLFSPDGFHRRRQVGLFVNDHAIPIINQQPRFVIDDIHHDRSARMPCSPAPAHEVTSMLLTRV